MRPPDQQQASPGPGMDADGASCLQGARRVSGRAAARAGSALAARGGAGSPPPPGAVSPARPGSQELRVSPGGGKPGWRIACSGLSSAQPPASRGPRASERACGRPPSRASRVSRGQPGLACKPTCSPSALAPRRLALVSPRAAWGGAGSPRQRRAVARECRHVPSVRGWVSPRQRGLVASQALPAGPLPSLEPPAARRPLGTGFGRHDPAASPGWLFQTSL